MDPIVTPVLLMVGSVAVAFITSYFTLKGRKIEIVKSEPHLMIDQLQEQMKTVQEDRASYLIELRQLREDQINCHKENLAHKAEINKLEIRLAQLEAELNMLQLQILDNANGVSDITEDIDGLLQRSRKYEQS